MTTTITYPLNVSLPTPAVGFAVANDEAEHKALTASGYVPAFVGPEPEGPGHTLESVKATLDAAGVEYDKRLGLAKLIELLPKD